MANNDLFNDLTKETLGMASMTDLSNIETQINIINNDILTINNDLSSIDFSLNIIENIIPSLFNSPKATYYKNVNQNLASGLNSLSWQEATLYSDLSLISQISSTQFQVNQKGFYYLEVQIDLILNGATWTNSAKYINFNLTRGGNLRIIYQPTAFIQTNPFIINFGIHYSLEVGDILDFRFFSAHTGTPQLLSIDAPPTDWALNTFFTWKLISNLS